jgi:hypothetical protein
LFRESEALDYAESKNWKVTSEGMVRIRSEAEEIPSHVYQEACQKQLSFITDVAAELEKLE